MTNKDPIKWKSLQELNELFANALALELLWEVLFMKLLVWWGIPQDNAKALIIVYNKFLFDYKMRLWVK